MKRIYLVSVNNKVSQLAYETLEEAQEFVESRLSMSEIEAVRNGQQYYNFYSINTSTQYVITDVMVDM